MHRNAPGIWTYSNGPGVVNELGHGTRVRQAGPAFRSFAMSHFDTEILLATYNGAKFLEDLLASLDLQTDQDWRLLVRDDGSTDDTLAILERWGKKMGPRLKILQDGKRNLGAAQNFAALLEACRARHFLLCDQDDVWFPDKVARLKASIVREEAEHGSDTPIIVHTDVTVANQALQTIADSFWHYQRIRMLPEKDPWKLITMQNVVTGCAMIGNAALLRAALPIPKDAMVHDWWLGLVCALSGRVVCEEAPSILYRQHSGNTLGAQEWSTWSAIKLVLTDPGRSRKKPRSMLNDTRSQAQAAVVHLSGFLSPEQSAFLTQYAGLGDRALLTRKLFPLRHRLYYHGMLRNIALYAVI